MPDFGTELTRAAAESQVVPRLVSEHPREWRLGPLTVVVGARGPAQLRYARLTVARAAPEPAAVMAGWRRALGALASRSLPPDELLPLLGETYAGLLDKEGRPAGDRVDLVAVREEIGRRRRGHTRAQFAWDIARLRREHRLVLEGRRIDLGVATAGATMRPSRVVWIEDESGAGQYYLHFRMVEERRDE